MAKIIGLPKLSPTMEQGTLLSWAKSEGDNVEVDDLLAEVETDKANMEFRSFDRGVLLKLLVEPGAILAPDMPVAIIGSKDEDISELLAKLSTANKAGATSPTDESKPAEETSPAKPVPTASPASQTKAPIKPEIQSNKTPETRTDASKVKASPVVRKIAREKGIDLSALQGSGPHGRLIKRDLDHPKATLPSGSNNRPAPIIMDASPMRKTIARRLVESKTTIPHYYLSTTINATPLWNAREQINSEFSEEQTRVSINDLIVKAAAVALRKHPEANASWINDQIVRYQVVDISIAVAVDDGLITPVVRDADEKNIADIAREIRDLAARARNKKLRAEELQGGTFSVSNLGMYHVENFAAVINPPQGAILAVGAVREGPVIENGQVIAGRLMSMTLSCDHRVIDGAVGAIFLDSLRNYLENPVTIFVR